MNFMAEYAKAPPELILNPELTGNAKNTWVVINYCAYNNGLVASNKELSLKLLVSEETIGKAIKSLENLGYISVEKKDKQRVLKVNLGYIKKYKHIKKRFEKMKREHETDTKKMLDESLGIS